MKIYKFLILNKKKKLYVFSFKLYFSSILIISCNNNSKIYNEQIVTKCDLTNSILIGTDLKPFFGADWILNYKKNRNYLVLLEDSSYSNFYIPKLNDSIRIDIHLLYCTHVIKNINSLYLSKTLNSHVINGTSIGTDKVAYNFIDTFGNRGIIFSYINSNQDSITSINGSIYLKEFQLIFFAYIRSTDTFPISTLQEFYCFLNSFNIKKYGLENPDCRPVFRNEEEYLEYIEGPNNIYRKK